VVDLRRLFFAAVVAAVVASLLSGVGLAAAQSAPENETGNNTTTDEPEPETTSDDPEVELQQSDFATIRDITWRDDHAIVTIRTTQPVSVTYPTQGTGEMDANEAQEVITTTDRIPRGETQIRVELADGNAFFTVDGATVVLSGEDTIDRSLIAYLGANQTLFLGAVLTAAAAAIAGYRQRLKDRLDKPENAFRGGSR